MTSTKSRHVTNMVGYLALTILAAITPTTSDFGSVTTTTTTSSASTRVVHTKYGALRGRLVAMDVVLDAQQKQQMYVEQYLGIPYASAPVKQLRFMPPNTCDPWQDVRPVVGLPPVCPQSLAPIIDGSEGDQLPPGRRRYLSGLYKYLGTQSEDCLYLNIYAPAVLSPHGKYRTLIVKQINYIAFKT